MIGLYLGKVGHKLEFVEGDELHYQSCNETNLVASEYDVLWNFNGPK